MPAERAIDHIWELPRPTPGTIADYLEALHRELAGADAALQQDALASAHEYLLGERADAAARGVELDEASLVARTLERYGTPQEVAEAYRASDRQRVAPGPFPVPAVAAPDIARRIFGVLLDPVAYGSAFYMFLSLATGIVYFTWAVTGLALSIGLLPIVIGLPFALLYLSSLRAFALIECRIVEGLLGERMPRRPPVVHGDGWTTRLKSRARDPRTWTTLLYMILKLPLGILYFTLFAILLSLTLGLAVAPFAQLLGVPLMTFGSWRLDVPWYVAFPLLWLAASFDLLVGLHLVRGVGRLHARFAKLMLVRT
jgi:hypothetical protein